MIGEKRSSLCFNHQAVEVKGIQANLRDKGGKKSGKTKLEQGDTGGIAAMEVETKPSLPGTSEAFLQWLEGWYSNLEAMSLRNDLLAGTEGAEQVAVLVVDLLVGFCSEGLLASPRVGALGPKAADFLTRVHAAGVRNILLAADAHPPDALEFAAFPPHCIVGTREAEIIPELTELPFASEMVTISKRSLAVGLEEEFRRWQETHPKVRTWIVVGDCTDLCVYHAAMHLRLHANARGREASVIVPADLVDTYDMPVETALQVGALPHDADLLHRLFLYHLALNGVRVMREITD